MGHIFLIIGVISLIISLVIAAASYIYLNQTFHKISAILDHFSKGDKRQPVKIVDTRESKMHAQLEQILSVSQLQAEEAKREKEMVTALISNLSHQLKTPLSNISLYTELLKDESLSIEEQKEFLNRSKSQVEKMEWLLKILFKTSQLETGMIEFEVEPHYIKKTIASGVSAVYGQALEKQINISVEDFQDRKLLHNPKWTGEVFANILENAIKYSLEGSEITIGVSPMELYTSIWIQDQGMGIDSSEYNQIFQRFYRSKDVEQKEGSGLGLYLSQLILSKEGGYITVSSKLGRGSTFFIHLQNDISR